MKTLTDVQVKKVAGLLQILRTVKEKEFNDTDNWIKSNFPISLGYEKNDSISYISGFLKTLNDYIIDYSFNYHPSIIEIEDEVCEKSDLSNFYELGCYKAYRHKEWLIKDLMNNDWDSIAVVKIHFPEVL